MLQYLLAYTCSIYLLDFLCLPSLLLFLLSPFLPTPSPPPSLPILMSPSPPLHSLPHSLSLPLSSFRLSSPLPPPPSLPRPYVLPPPSFLISTSRLIFPSPFKARSFLSHIQHALHPPTDYRNIFAFVHKAYHKDLRLAGRGVGFEGGGATKPGKGSSFKGTLHKIGSRLMSLIPEGVVSRDDAVTDEYSRMGMGLSCSSGRGYATSARGQSTGGKSSPEGRVWRVTQCNSKYE